jgi:predicted O-linked N-acetylglucosamine transferase (SPINDLY family)
VACADVVLDPSCYGGGANTVYDAAAAGVPTLTVPGRLQRTRWAAAVNDRLGVAAELNAADAADYVRRAVRVATDRDLRADVVRRTVRAADALFEDAAAVRELQAYFLAAADPVDALHRH